MTGEPTSEDVRADLKETGDLIRSLTDVRFKLLAFVPTVCGTAIALMGRGQTSAELLAVGLIGLCATTGIIIFDLRNTQLLDYAVLRAKRLEAKLGLSSVFDPSAPGGLYTERPGRDLRLFGLAVGHDRGLALVYSVAIGGWCYLVGWGGLRALGVGDARTLGAVVGVVGAVVVMIEFLRIDGRPAASAQPRASAGALPLVE
jgi:hypothetical protein